MHKSCLIINNHQYDELVISLHTDQLQNAYSRLVICNQSQPLFTAWAWPLLPSQAKEMLCPAPSQDCRMLTLALLDKLSPILARFSGLPPYSSLKRPKASFFLNEYFSKNKNSQVTVFSLTLARSPMASRSYQRASDFLNYLPGLASDILAAQKSEKKEK